MEHRLIANNLPRLARMIENSSSFSISRPEVETSKGWCWYLRLVIRALKGNTERDLNYARRFFDLKANVFLSRNVPTLRICRQDLVTKFPLIVPYLSGRTRRKAEIFNRAVTVNNGSRDVVTERCMRQLGRLNNHPPRAVYIKVIHPKHVVIHPKVRHVVIHPEEEEVTEEDFEPVYAFEPPKTSLWRSIVNRFVRP